MYTKSDKTYFQHSDFSIEKSSSCSSLPFDDKCFRSKGLSFVISEIIKEEFPSLSDSLLLKDLALILLSQRLGTVQLLKNELSCQKIID